MADLTMGGVAVNTPTQRSNRFIVLASSLGTVFEWYDFYLFGSLIAVIRAQFLSGVDPTTGFIFALLIFAAGFFVRPFGALVFGRVGDIVGRKYTFLVTITIMGLSTFLVGLLPSYSQIGISAPILLICLRLLQGLALGGEYGGAATYVAEHAPPGRRGLMTSWIQTTATLGLLLSIIIIIICQQATGPAKGGGFETWGWRIPFLFSIVLLGFSLWIRLKLSETPLFARMKSEGLHSRRPLIESFARWPNLKIVLLALFGLTAGEAVVWYTGQFYTLFFLQKMLKVDLLTSNLLIGAALLLASPCFILFGWLSDKIGRKPIIMAGCLLAAVTYFPLFHALTNAANPELAAAQAKSPAVIVADPAQCSLQLDLTGTSKFTSPCDVAKASLANNGVPYTTQNGAAGSAQIRIGSQPPIDSYDAKAPDAAAKGPAFQKALTGALTQAGYPAQANPTATGIVLSIIILTIMVIYVTMVYGPIAAMLVELFPTRIRYSSISLPYHIGNGWFGGFLPAISFAIVASTGNIYSGLWYPIVVAVITLVVGTVLLRETKDRPLDA